MNLGFKEPSKLLADRKKTERANSEIAKYERERQIKNSKFGRFLNAASKVRQRQLSVGRAISNEPSFLSQNFIGYNQSKRSAITGRIKYGRGRPKGTYDSRYAKFGGVYGYRKYLTTQLKIQRLQAMRENAVTPQQQMIIRQIEAREQARRVNPENRTIPDTYGHVSTRSVHQEIDDAANIVP